MRINILLTLLLFILPLNALVIESGKEFAEFVSPDIMNSKIAVQSKTLKYDEAKIAFDKIVKSMKASGACQGGAYHINPEFNYEKNKKTFVKYNGYLEFDCEFAESKVLDDAILLINNDMPKSLFYLNIGEIYWNVSPKSKQKVEFSLKDTAVLYGISEAVRFSTLLNMKCETKKVSINQQASHFALMKSNMSENTEKPNSTEVPIKKDIRLQSFANYEIECKHK